MSVVKIATVFVTLLCCTSLAADEIDRYVERRLREMHIPGASLAVVRDGRIVKAKGYGLANIELSVPATPSTVYEIGSNTKQFTAAAIMMLVEEGKLRLDDKITKYFPAAPPSWSGITIAHLLTHTSGIQNHVAVPGYLGVFKTNLFFETTPSRSDLLQMFYKLPLEFQPGETWSYDNTGYHLLGTIIEQVSGKPYFQFLSERIFAPLAMTSTRSTDARPLVRNRAAGYEWVDGAYENRPALPPAVGFSAGSILSTVEDLAKWDAALASEKLLTPASRERIWTPARTNDGAFASFDYGFGWFIDSYHGHRFVQHTGGTPGFSSAIYRFLDDKLTVIVLTNHNDRVIDPIAIDIAGFYVRNLKRPESALDPDPQTSARVRAAFADLLAGKPDPSAFTPPMQTFLGTMTGKAFWQWFASLGPLKTFTFSDSESREANRVLRYRVVLGDSAYWFSANVAPDGRIAQFVCW